MPGFVVNLYDYVPPARFDATHWTQAQIAYSPDNVQAYTILATITLSPVDGNPAEPITRNFTVSNAPTADGWLLVTFLDAFFNQAPTKPVQYPPSTGHGAASPTLLSARYAVRHRIRDGVPLLDANPVPFNMVRLENLSDQIVLAATPTGIVFQTRYSDVPTQRYMNAQVCPGTLVAYLDGSWSAVSPNDDVDVNGNFTLPVPPVSQLLVTYAWQYFSDGEIDQFVDEGRQWLRSFSTVDQIPDGLVPALVSYASARSMYALARTANLADVKAGDSAVDWAALSKQYLLIAQGLELTALGERKDFYTLGPEAFDPNAADVSAPNIPPYGPLR